MLVNPLTSPSTKYIIEPIMVTMVRMKNRKTIIFLLDDMRASSKRLASPMYRINFRILNILNTLKIRITLKYLLAGINMLT
jgi:hypothetical protein